MTIDTFLFGIVSFASVLLYYPIANAGNWKARSTPANFETTYWNAFQTFIWSLAIVVFRSGPTPSFWASLAVFPTTIIYGLLSEQPGMEFDLTGNNPLTSLQIGVLTTVGVFVFLYAVILFYKQDYRVPFSVFLKFSPLLVFIIWLLTWLGVNKQSTSTTSQEVNIPSQHISGGVIPGYTVTTNYTTSYNLHIHHWIIGVIGFLLANDSAIYSQVISGIFWGVFCQEAAAYGIALPSDPRETSSSSTSQIASSTWLGPGGNRREFGPGGQRWPR